MENTKKIDWYTLAFMAFSTVWGFGNVLNGFVYFNGVQVIFSWVLMFALYFVPYALMVGELGSAFKQSGGGVSSWIHETIGPKCAYYAGWTYWACHVTYIASKGSGGLKALSWMVFQNGSTYDTFPTIAVQMATLAVFLFFCWVASRGLNPLKKLATIAGSSMFVMSILFILMMFAAPVINPNGGFVSADYTVKGLIPQFNVNYFTSLSILVFAVGGCEKISPYVNKVKDPSKGFPKGMIMLAVMVMVCAILGSIAMGMMFDPVLIEENFDSYNANGSYWAFQKLGEYYGVGNLIMIIYAACNAIGQFSTLVVSIDAPLRMLLDCADENYIPKAMFKQNEYGTYTNGHKLVMVIVSILIIVPAFGIDSVDTLVRWLVKVNSVCMPLRYLWVFVAYIALKKAGDKFPAQYHIVKNKTVGMIFGGWCFLFTAFACIMGIYSEDRFQLILNIVTPFVLIGLGFIMPMIARRTNKK